MRFTDGTCTYLHSDMVASTKLWTASDQLARAVIARHDTLIEDSIARHHGHIVRSKGDSFAAAFSSVDDAVDAAVLIQRQFATEQWPTHAPVQLRIGIHRGPAPEGWPLDPGARLSPSVAGAIESARTVMRAADAGQILIDDSACDDPGITRSLTPLDAPMAGGAIDLGRRLHVVHGPHLATQSTSPVTS